MLYDTVAFDNDTLYVLQFREELHPVAEVKLGQLYAVISSYSSQWSRASVIEILSEEKVSVVNCY